MMDMQITIANQFNGPPTSGNGGYSAGMLGRLIDGPATVRLHAPPPLDTPLDVVDTGEGLAARHGETLVMSAKTGALRQGLPTPPSLEAARHGRESYAGFTEHGFPSCFVCGPERTPGDGLCIYTGDVEGFRGVTDVWMPDVAFADENGLMPPEIIWAAMDCPSYFSIPGEAKPALLGSMTAAVNSQPAAGEPVIVASWHERSDGRKHYTGTALFTQDGDCLAQADTLWIELKPNA